MAYARQLSFPREELIGGVGASYRTDIHRRDFKVNLRVGHGFVSCRERRGDIRLHLRVADASQIFHCQIRVKVHHVDLSEGATCRGRTVWGSCVTEHYYELPQDVFCSTQHGFLSCVASCAPQWFLIPFRHCQRRRFSVFKQIRSLCRSRVKSPRGNYQTSTKS